MADVKKFEAMPPEDTFARSVNAGLPLWVVRCAYAGYSLPRHLRIGAICAPGVIACSGIVAGHTVAMHIVAAPRS